MKIQLKTLSNYPEVKSEELSSDSLFQTSVTTTNGYVSKKLRYDTLLADIKEEIVELNEKNYNLQKGMNVGEISGRIDNLLSSNTNFTGNVKFENTPKINDKEIATVEDITDKIQQDNGIFISEDSEKLREYELTASKTDTANEHAGYEETIEETGILTLYGTLADTGVVSPAEAWVALKGKINNNQSWTILQVQPWIIGAKSSQLQYVSFTIPVYKGLKIKIETGFTLNGNNTGAQNINGSLVIDGQPNTFKGYVIGKGE